ncbi:hypothetical protein BRARA_G00220 [Brassica rapa]|uniref:Defensin-like domain-containing protein n=3 Tax=Brassica TaxID=3705 RepID=A0ABQ8CJ95_BRANA|nr:hypothetical protein IGI04_025813 [Brassica rapa subsp. trilocularis]KAH0917161.1 hypothetical protein HID58_024821 [Brassica napus]RID52781.1 hypothetical protein BRARA_G00220 [Brassica rapa]
MDSFKLVVIFTLLAMTAISCDFFPVEAEIFVQAATPICGPDCNGTFSFQQCYNHCVELGYKRGFCILSEPIRYRCCCPSN